MGGAASSVGRRRRIKPAAGTKSHSDSADRQKADEGLKVLRESLQRLANTTSDAACKRELAELVACMKDSSPEELAARFGGRSHHEADSKADGEADSFSSARSDEHELDEEMANWFALVINRDSDAAEDQWHGVEQQRDEHPPEPQSPISVESERMPQDAAMSDRNMLQRQSNSSPLTPNFMNHSSSSRGLSLSRQPSLDDSKPSLAVDVRLRDGRTMVMVASFGRAGLVQTITASLERQGLSVVSSSMKSQAAPNSVNGAGSAADSVKHMFQVVDASKDEPVVDQMELKAIESALSLDLARTVEGDENSTGDPSTPSRIVAIGEGVTLSAAAMVARGAAMLKSLPSSAITTSKDAGAAVLKTAGASARAAADAGTASLDAGAGLLKSAGGAALDVGTAAGTAVLKTAGASAKMAAGVSLDVGSAVLKTATSATRAAAGVSLDAGTAIVKTAGASARAAGNLGDTGVAVLKSSVSAGMSLGPGMRRQPSVPKSMSSSTTHDDTTEEWEVPEIPELAPEVVKRRKMYVGACGWNTRRSFMKHGCICENGGEQRHHECEGGLGGLEGVLLSYPLFYCWALPFADAPPSICLTRGPACCGVVCPGATGTFVQVYAQG